MDIVKKGGLGILPAMVAGGKPSLPLGLAGVGVQALMDSDPKKKKPPVSAMMSRSGGGALSSVNPMRTVYK